MSKLTMKCFYIPQLHSLFLKLKTLTTKPFYIYSILIGKMIWKILYWGKQCALTCETWLCPARGYVGWGMWGGGSARLHCPADCIPPHTAKKEAIKTASEVIKSLLKTAKKKSPTSSIWKRLVNVEIVCRFFSVLRK